MGGYTHGKSSPPLGPTADDVAVAVVAACQETGDDPISTHQGGLGVGRATNRARHYALHALVHVFPHANRLRLCEWVGCPGKPGPFWNSSLHQVVKPRYPGSATRMANWFDDAAYDRVIRAVEADRTRRAVAPAAEREVEVNHYAEPPAYPSRPGAPGLPASRAERIKAEASRVTAALDDDARSRFAGLGAKERVPAPIENKSKLQDMLRDAVANTAKMQEGSR